MKQQIKIVIMVLGVMVAFASVAQKKVKTFAVEKEFDIPASEIWKVVGEDYGYIAYSHPKILNSEYINGSLKAEEGAERICYFNEQGTQFVKEKMLDYDPDNMSFTNTVFQAGKFPVDPEYTQAIYSVTDLGNGRSKMSFDMEFRTKPALMGAMMKGSFKKLIADYFIAIEHHVKTGEKVTSENFKEIKKGYKS